MLPPFPEPVTDHLSPLQGFALPGHVTSLSWRVNSVIRSSNQVEFILWDKVGCENPVHAIINTRSCSR